MKYLLSGSNGFIGSALKQELSKKGYQVIPLPRALLYNKEKLKIFLKDCQPDYIFHLAAYGNKYDQKDIEKIVKANIDALWNLLWLSRNIPYKGFINVSSSSTLLPYETFYSATKGAGERLVEAFVNKYGKPVATVRPFSVYGPGDDPKHFIPTAIEAFKFNEPLTLAPGCHDWIYIDDLISGIITVANNIEQVKGENINIGTGKDTTNQGVVASLKELFSKPGNITKVDPIREYDNAVWVADNKRLRSLGWDDEIDLDTGLKRLIYGDN